MNRDQVRALRGRLKLTQADFAAAIGVTMNAVQKWEAGTHKPSRLAARELARLADGATKQQEDVKMGFNTDNTAYTADECARLNALFAELCENRGIDAADDEERETWYKWFSDLAARTYPDFDAIEARVQ